MTLEELVRNILDNNLRMEGSDNGSYVRLYGVEKSVQEITALIESWSVDD